MSDHAASLVIRPEVARWRAALRRVGRPAAWRAEARRELGLPDDRPVVMSGHQAGFWHPGILAKHFACVAIAREAGAFPAWVVVDHDANAPWRIAYPSARLGRERWDMLPGVRDDVPPASRSTIRAEDIRPPASAFPFVSDGLARMASALARRADEPTLGAQFTAAVPDASDGLITGWNPRFATALARTSLFDRVVRRMAADPGACVAAYNRAVGNHPGARLRPLATTPRLELPLWRLEPGRSRRAMFADELTSGSGADLAPRALLLTGLLRLALCDLFIHGLGGEVYDRATQEWLAAWEPIPGAGVLALPGVVTATRYLPLGAEVPAPAEIARASWLAHRAGHDPGVVEDAAAAARKRELVRMARHGTRAQRLDAYRALHAFLREYRSSHARELERLSARADELSARRDAADVAYDRTWAFPMYPTGMLSGLRDEVEGAFGA